MMVQEKNIAVIGAGHVWSAIAYSLLLLSRNNIITLVETHVPNLLRAEAEYNDLLPVALATGNTLRFSQTVKDNYDIYIIAAGKARKSPDEPKSALLVENLRIVNIIADHIPRGKTIYVVSNPPPELCAELERRSKHAIPIREQTDLLRSAVGDKDWINKFVLRHKGHTAFTPAYAAAREILGDGRQGR